MFTFINEAKMPALLTREHFRIWCRKANIVLSVLGSDVAPKSLNIAFSDEAKAVTYGTKTLEDIKEEIGNCWEIDSVVADTLAQIQKIEDYYKGELPFYLAEAISACNPDYSPEEIHEMLDDLFGLGKFTARTTGEYCHVTKTITLYTQNILSLTMMSGRSDEENFVVTFIHELFHAYHYQHNDKELIYRWDYTASVVKESLAAAFEWHYCKTHGISDTGIMWKTWKMHSVLVYPYSGAQYLIDEIPFILREVDLSIVFQMSLTDMDCALRNLVPEKIFYRIKNQFTSNKIILLKKHIKKLSREELEALLAGKTVGTIAREEIPPIIKAKKHLIPDLMDRTYCKNIFNLDTYNVLALTRIYSTPHYRYYPDATNVDATDYYICSQWYEKHRKNLLDWIWTYR